LEGASRADEGPAGILATAQGLIRAMLGRNQIDQIAGAGVATSGAVDKKRGVIRSSADFMPGWHGFEIKKSFESMLAPMQTPGRAWHVVVDNDGNCALHAEVRSQSLEHGDVVLLALGTGLGGAIYANGRVREGASALSGHFGQTLVGEATRPDEWRKLETHLSGSGLAMLARRLLEESDQQADPAARFPDGHSVISAMPASEFARAALSRWIRLLAITCHNIQWNYDPERIIIGGGMIEANEAWWADFLQTLTSINRQFRLHREMDVRPATLGNDAAMVGAGLMAWETLEATGREDAS